MGVGPCKPLPPSMTISSFSGDVYGPAGYATLRVALEEGPKRLEREIDFIIMDAPSGYNAILERPAMAAFQMVASMYHLYVKFPTPFGVATISGDKAGASKCFEINARLHTDYMDPRDHTLPPVEQNDHITVADGKTILISKNFPDNKKPVLATLLFEYFDVFAWEPSDMPRIDRIVAEHRLSLKSGVAPVIQKKRSFGGEKQHAIREEVEKLLAAGFIREITYPSWLANVVVVKKNSGKWRMCVDFTDLNKACPKYFYPLPKIDRLVDSSAGYSVISFVDAFSGYHQIRMAKDDEEHTSFITDQGTFCYKVMPFGLKNAGASYQRMIDTVFKNQRGRNVEAYVDDVLIKSKCVKRHLEDLRETLDTCRTYNIKLNPLKSIFGSSYDKFLGHMVSARGIEANPEKIQAIQEMKPPRTVQDIQKLNGRVTTLSRFISKSGERCLPFFKILRGENQAWNEDCAKAFQSLKEYLLSPPLLSAPVQDEDLFLYLSATDNSVSAVLVREEAARQHLIHYISHILHGAEVRYPPLEKLSFALISAARRLRHYFQAHPIKVMTDQPLRRILHSPEISGRLQKWQ
ncbi:RNA-directed DNA polymerase like [Apostasia shenzhenica]|uniref:RNA-directed DNA polymerase like n=1 Tax=Apostasia shenzhenica TaxID=1088818 RepID=A0A2I0ATV0_9ASPA|nr:RNA-directed DNA polymerase like [Apostasia shenzhenica]